MKNLLLVFTFLFSLSSFLYSQEKTENGNVKLKKAEVTNQQTVKIKPAKKVAKAPVYKKADFKAIRKKKDIKNEDEN
tara:strand:+ start:35623 stop:35853 length:231 start_codon:yes stop_codon:yes gene_type:complete